MIRRGVEDFGHIVGVEALIGAQELRLQIGGDGQIEHHVDRMLVLLHADLAERLAHVLLEFFVVLDPLHDQILRIAAYTRLQRADSRVGFIGLADDRPAHLRVLHLGQLFLDRAGGQHAPGGARVIQVPVLEGEGEAAADRRPLTENRQALGTAAIKPAQQPAMDFRDSCASARWPGTESAASRHPASLFDEGEVGTVVGRVRSPA